jgi:glyoxylase-like metal-dependent hydrolase (beta-lactamase superfamily II)
MQRERVAEDIYVFASERYAQVTATVVTTGDGAVLFDTLLYPEETLSIKRFIESRLNTPIRYVINSHFHADHSTGTCFFDGVPVIAHVLCRDLLDQRGRQSLEAAKAASDEMRDVQVVLPGLVFENGHFFLYLGEKSFEFWHTPGHSPDSIVCLIHEDRVLLAADTLMPIPHFVGGSFEDCIASLRGLLGGNFEHVVQGHGDVILKGEVEEKVQSDLEYLDALQSAVDKALTSDEPDVALSKIDIERCGKSRILLNGAAEQLHRQNVLALASQRRVAIEI